MTTRRQEKMSREVKEVVSDAISNHLSDPRIEGFVSVTRVEMSPDLRSGDVYISIFGGDDSSQKKTFLAIQHAKSRIQSLLGGKLQSKFCPLLYFYIDERFKKTQETMNIIEKAVSELEEKESIDEEQN